MSKLILAAAVFAAASFAHAESFTTCYASFWVPKSIGNFESILQQVNESQKSTNVFHVVNKSEKADDNGTTANFYTISSEELPFGGAGPATSPQLTKQYFSIAIDALKAKLQAMAPGTDNRLVDYRNDGCKVVQGEMVK